MSDALNLYHRKLKIDVARRATTLARTTGVANGLRTTAQRGQTRMSQQLERMSPLERLSIGAALARFGRHRLDELESAQRRAQAQVDVASTHYNRAQLAEQRVGELATAAQRRWQRQKASTREERLGELWFHYRGAQS